MTYKGQNSADLSGALKRNLQVKIEELEYEISDFVSDHTSRTLAERNKQIYGHAVDNQMHIQRLDQSANRYNHNKLSTISKTHLEL